MKRSGFTLAEVLLVIVVIGIIAMETIPTLVLDIKSQQAVTGVKKAMSEIMQAYSSFAADGTTMDTVFVGTQQHASVLNQFCTKLNCIKNCGTGTGCFPDILYLKLDGTGWLVQNQNTSIAKAILADGSSIAIIDWPNSCVNDNGDNLLDNLCGHIIVDINGFNGPNQIGRDVFLFWVTKNGVAAFGSNNDPFISTCSTSNTGQGCASKVLTDGSITY